GAAGDEPTLVTAVGIATNVAEHDEPGRFGAIEALLSGLQRNPHAGDVLGKEATGRLQKLASECVTIAKDDGTNVKTRIDCIRILGRTPEHVPANIETLAAFLSADHDSQIQVAAID